MAQKFDTLTAEIGLAVTRIVETDLALLRGYSRAKARAIASFTVLLGEGYATGRVSDEQMTMEMVELERMVVRFVRNMQALATTTVERLLRSIGAVLSATLQRVIGLPILPMAPSTGMVWGVGPG
jgi:hypothetical protein